MTLTVRLLGRPEIERDGPLPRPPRGRKGWAVLTYLALAERPVGRGQLAGLLFGDAADPLGALRWTLAELRRALGAPDALRGDPVVLALPKGARVDVLALDDPELIRGELLEGADPEAGAVFEAWLVAARRRVAGECEGILRVATLDALAAGRPRDGAALAARAVALSPYDDANHELLVRCHRRAGDVGAAQQHARSCAELFRRELGREPHAGVRRAADPEPPALGDRAAAAGQLAAGRTALGAGAVEPGVELLRLACAEARAAGDAAFLAEALAALGAALVHSVRGRDEEGAVLLREALELAEAAGLREVAVEAARELGYVEVQAGRALAAGRWLQRATALARTDAERAAVLGVRGMALSDRAHYGAAILLLEESVGRALACGSTRQAAWSSALLGRTHVLRGDLRAARAAHERAMELIAADGWVAFRPFPESQLAEIALLEGDPAAGARLAAQAYATGCHLGDPCWEALAARALGLCEPALGRLREAAERAVRVPDPYVWVHAHCLDALAAAAIGAGEPDAADVVAQLERVAARGGMRELVVRAALHRAALGDPGGVAAAALLAEGIDNPRLEIELHTPRHTVAG